MGTANYNLKQWKSWEAPDHGTLNGALAAVDGALAGIQTLAEGRSQIVFGSYVGDGEKHRTIDLGFPIQWVFLYPADHSPGNFKSGLAAPGYPPPVGESYAPHLSVAGNTIQVGFVNNYGPYTNYPETVFYYIAAKGA